MTADEIAGHWKLNVTVLPNGRCKEIISNTTTRQDAPLDECVVIWNRHRDLAERVFLEKSSKGELRAIKRVALRADGNHPELDIIDKIIKAAGTKAKESFVDFKGWYFHEDYLHFAMEYCPWGDIDMCYPLPVSETEARSICDQILEALQILHEAGIVHRDIKPKNVLVAEKIPVHVKLADFGISKHTEGTELKTQVGTFGYMAPEVLGLLEDDYNYTKAVDIWSLGCLVYKILTGEPPFTWMPHLPLERYVKGHSLFPEQPLLERGIGIDGRSFIAKMLRPVPKTRSSASITLIEEWIVPQMPSFEVPAKKLTSISSGQPSTPPGDLTQDDGIGSLQPTSSSNDMSTKLSTDLSTDGPMAKSEMDYLSLELWSQVRREGWLEDGTARLERLLEAGANPNIIRLGYTALHLALLNSPSTSTKPTTWVSTLLKYGANPNLKNQDGFYASHQMVGLLQHRAYSTQEKRISPNLLFICNKLLAYGAWLEARDNMGYTPLIFACTLRDGPMVDFLLQKGADVHASCFQGRTTLFHIVWNGGDLETVKLLLSKGADINTQDVQGVTLLEAAMRQSLNYSVIAHLVNNGAEYNPNDGGIQRRIQRARLWEKIRKR